MVQIQDLNDVIVTLLQGLSLTAIGLFAYGTGYRWFKSIRSHEFESKEGAQITLITFLFLTGLFGPVLLRSFESLSLNTSLIQEIGVIIIFSRLLINGMVPHWNTFDTNSILLYSLGVVLFVIG